ncbi:hypothetical protein BaRGS_00038293 [Batillaria attramentaria]|uniref:SRR1-like domain-containing protein n=1 Tax=Batillaria attramentaria TaxID=370345 RepID=A0ABD0J6S5_9CAEN
MPQKGVQDRVDVIVDSDRHRVTKRIRDCRTELEASDFYRKLLARYQLSLVLALRDHLQVSPEHCQVYDPQFTETEKLILQEFDCTLIRRNEEGKRRCERPTLVVMPHCGKALFNNFLWANWRPQSLQQLIIIGNSFSNMLDSSSKILPFVKEEAVQNTFTYTDIFNDLSVHWFPLENLQRVAPGTWTQPDEPVYLEDDLEIIQDSLNKL